MSTLQQQILQLSVADRLQLISFIASSISPETVQASFHVPDEWIEEALARDAAHEADPSRAQPWDEVKARIYGKQ